MAKPPFRPVVDLVRRRHPGVDDPAAMVARGEVRVDGAVVTNPAARARADAVVTLHPARELQGRRKLAAVLDALAAAPAVEGRVALDVGASTGGFTTELLARGARRVYAVDVGHGQLLGSLRQDPRVVNLETTNAADLSADLVPEPVGVATVDVSFTPLAVVVPQFSERVAWAPGAALVALVKPMFELQRGELPTDPAELDEAARLAAAGIAAAGWRVVETVRSPVEGHKGAVEFAVHAERPGTS